MSESHKTIAASLQVVPPFSDQEVLKAEVERRLNFIIQTLGDSGMKTLVLGISGGVDSLLAGRLAQLAVERLRQQSGERHYRFIAVRLPYRTQGDASDAQAAMEFVCADEGCEISITDSVDGLVNQIGHLQALPAAQRDFVIGNIKARCRMVAQYAIANATSGLVIGTDHAAEAVMGFFTKFGDGAADLMPLSGLVKHQIRAMASYLGAPDWLVNKVPTADLEELHPGKPDEVAYGVAYREIDAFLHGQPVSEAAQHRILNAYEVSAHKRRLPLIPE
jgi:NAD+ synthase